MPDAKSNDFKIGRTDRAFFVGATGTGKTTLAKALMYGLPNVVVLDPKRTFTLPKEWEHTLYTSFSRLAYHTGPETAIYRPDVDSIERMHDGKNPDPFFDWIFRRRNTYLYVDEVISVVNGSRIGKGYAICLQLGRERGIATWSATQRPAAVPLVILTESEHYFVFRLRNIEDRRRMYEWTGHSELLYPPRHEHGFFYYYDRTGKLKYFPKAKVGKVLSK